MKKYYAVFGVNGLGVYDKYYLVENSRKYLQHFRCKRCDSRMEAESVAINGYNSFQTFSDAIRFDGRLEKMNWIEYPYLRRKEGIAMVKVEVVKPLVVYSS